jgi:serine/threonine protein phosphatase PrpC
LLRSLDLTLFAEPAAGEATAIIALVTPQLVVGASVGDSEAWLIRHGVELVLTEAQNRKPLLGSGRAEPVGFGPVRLEGRLVVASDGLFKYCDRERLLSVATAEPLGVAATNLVAEARLPSGALQDDVSIVLCDRTPR